MLIYVISDRRSRPDLTPARLVEAAARSGADMLQIREKDLPAGDVLRLARRAVDAGGARIYVNGRADVALAASAEGVHLPADGMPVARVVAAWGDRLAVGASTHSLAEARAAEAGGAVFVTFGPVYDTPSKRRYGPPIGPDRLAEAAAALTIPVLAIGGIVPARMAEIRSAGAAGAAIISAVLGAEDMTAAVAALRAGAA